MGVHPGWDFTTKVNDIAIVGYEGSFNLTEFVKPVSLPKQGQSTTGDVVITGWGSSNDTNLVSPDILQKFRLPVISDQECLDGYTGETLFKPIDSMLCAKSGLGGHAFCAGDLGGPAVASNGGYLAGILAYPEVINEFYKY